MTRFACFAFLLSLSACGDDSGGGDGDGGGDPFDAAVAIDAPPAADAPPPTPDARTDFPGLDNVCTCDATMMCEGGLVCFVNAPSPPHLLMCPAPVADGGTPESGVCRPRVGPCATNAMDCPFPSRCIMFSDGMGLCAPAVVEGEMCRPERCEETLLCVGPSDDMAFCRTQCTMPTDCDPTETCTPVGDSRMACIPNL